MCASARPLTASYASTDDGAATNTRLPSRLTATGPAVAVVNCPNNWCDLASTITTDAPTLFGPDFTEM